MKTCILCNKSYKDEYTSCPVCGFPYLETLDGGDRSEEIVLGKVSRAMGDLLSQVTVSVVVYAYEENQSGLLELKREEELLMARGRQLSYGRAFWYQEQFDGVDRDCQINILVRDIKGRERQHSLDIASAGLADSWQIGVQLEDELMIRILLGHEDNYVRSEPVSLL